MTNLRALASEIVDSSHSPDPGVMAEELISRLKPRDFREMALAVARDYIRGAVLDRRRGAVTPMPSRKVEAAREAWKRMLDQPEFVPSVGWVYLRDATAEQVREMADMRTSKATELTTAAARYSALADQMAKHSVMRVADLPDDVLSPLLGETSAA